MKKNRSSLFLIRQRAYHALPFVLFAILFAFASPARLVGQSAGGQIVGRVSNDRTGAYLEGASVSIQGSTRSVTTDRNGSFVLSDIAPGTHNVIVRYTGFPE